MTNKEVVKKLIEYYRKQDIETIYRILANFQIDFNRLDNINLLSEEERCLFFTRVKCNAASLRRFIENEREEKPLKLTNIDEI